MVAANVAPRRVDVARLGDDLEVLLRVEQQAQSAADHRMVVGEDDTDGTTRHSPILPFVLGHANKGSAVVSRGGGGGAGSAIVSRR